MQKSKALKLQLASLVMASSVTAFAGPQEDPAIWRSTAALQVACQTLANADPKAAALKPAEIVASASCLSYVAGVVGGAIAETEMRTYAEMRTKTAAGKSPLCLGDDPGPPFEYIILFLDALKKDPQLLKIGPHEAVYAAVAAKYRCK